MLLTERGERGNLIKIEQAEAALKRSQQAESDSKRKVIQAEVKLKQVNQTTVKDLRG